MIDCFMVSPLLQILATNHYTDDTVTKLILFTCVPNAAFTAPPVQFLLVPPAAQQRQTQQQ